MILFVTEDAGPAEYLSRVIHRLPGKKVYCAASGAAASIFKKNGILALPECAEDLSTFTLVVTGTCWGDGLDKQYIKRAGGAVPVISVIDHWSWYRERFLMGGEWNRPDYIVVNDETAKREAIEEGLPESLLYPLGNPVLEECAAKTLSPLPVADWRRDIGLAGKPVITFISEEYKKDFPVGSEFYMGFHEYDALDDIISVAGKAYNVLVKLHPSESREKYRKYEGLDNVSLVHDGDFDSLITHSLSIIGMGSMLLIEAALHRRDIISYRPGELRGFAGNRIGATFLVKHKDTLASILGGEKKISNRPFAGHFAGSTERIISFIKEQELST